jgi:hypothetical protein
VLARLARAVLAVALLVAGQAALLHPLQHVDKHGALIHVGDGQSRSHDGSDSSSGMLCDVLASLAAFVSGPVALPAVTIPTQFQPAYRAGELRISGAPPFLSQGPPALL